MTEASHGGINHGAAAVQGEAELLRRVMLGATLAEIAAARRIPVLLWAVPEARAGG